MEERTIRCGGEIFTIGPPEKDDWPWIVEGLVVSYAKDIPTSMMPDEGMIRERVEEEVQGLRENKYLDNEVFVIRDESGIRAAYLWIMAVPLQFTGEMRGWMFQLYVSEDFRGKGLGKALMSLGEEWTLSRDMRSIAVMVGSGNDGGMGILRSMGFEIEGYNMGKPLDRSRHI